MVESPENFHASLYHHIMSCILYIINVLDAIFFHFNATHNALNNVLPINSITALASLVPNCLQYSAKKL